MVEIIMKTVFSTMGTGSVLKKKLEGPRSIQALIVRPTNAFMTIFTFFTDTCFCCKNTWLSVKSLQYFFF